MHILVRLHTWCFAMGPPAIEGWALMGPPRPLWAGPLWASLGPYGPCPYGPPWALMGRALMGQALIGRALMGQALMAPLDTFFF